jgi:hypothetical protein
LTPERLKQLVIETLWLGFLVTIGWSCGSLAFDQGFCRGSQAKAERLPEARPGRLPSSRAFCFLVGWNILASRLIGARRRRSEWMRAGKWTTHMVTAGYVVLLTVLVAVAGGGLWQLLAEFNREMDE